MIIEMRFYVVHVMVICIWVYVEIVIKNVWYNLDTIFLPCNEREDILVKKWSDTEYESKCDSYSEVS